MIDSVFNRLMNVRIRLAAVRDKQSDIRSTLQELDTEAEFLMNELRAINDELERATK